MSEQIRRETQAERDESYKKLNHIIKRTVFSSGMDSEYNTRDGIVVYASIAEFISSNNSVVKLSVSKSVDIELGQLIIASYIQENINDYPQTITWYKSINKEPFERYDISLSDLSYGQPERQTSQILGGIAFGTAVAAMMQSNQSTGIDGHPITALETNGLIEEITRSKEIYPV